MADVTEFEDLDALLTSAGWARFERFVADQWGTSECGGGIRFQQAVMTAAREPLDADATSKLRQVCVAQREIQNLLIEFKGQRERARPLEQRAEVALSRRGGL